MTKTNQVYSNSIVFFYLWTMVKNYKNKSIHAWYHRCSEQDNFKKRSLQRGITINLETIFSNPWKKGQFSIYPTRNARMEQRRRLIGSEPIELHDFGGANTFYPSTNFDKSLPCQRSRYWYSSRFVERCARELWYHGSWAERHFFSFSMLRTLRRHRLIRNRYAN